MTAPEVEELLSQQSETVRAIAEKLLALVEASIPDAVEEPDASSKMVGFTFIPQTYRGLIVAVAPKKAHVNLMFAKGVELLELDEDGLLEGTGVKARHIKFRSLAEVERQGVVRLVEAAAKLTPRE